MSELKMMGHIVFELTYWSPDQYVFKLEFRYPIGKYETSDQSTDTSEDFNSLKIKTIISPM